MCVPVAMRVPKATQRLVFSGKAGGPITNAFIHVAVGCGFSLNAFGVGPSYDRTASRRYYTFTDTNGVFRIPAQTAFSLVWVSLGDHIVVDEPTIHVISHYGNITVSGNTSDAPRSLYWKPWFEMTDYQKHEFLAEGATPLNGGDRKRFEDLRNDILDASTNTATTPKQSN